MEQLNDSALLQQYVESQSDEAFAALVTRHINLVYSVALRQTGSPDNAEEIAQAVFVILAKKAKELRHEKALSSWLFQATRLTAANLIRSESRRRDREQEAYMQSALNDAPDETWIKIAPLLDDAVANLREKDRRAILMRFYEGRNLQEVGAALGASPDAAEKRVSRALDKMRHYFSRRGVSSTTAIISEQISANSVQVAPAALAKTVAAVALAKGATASVSTLTLIKGALKVMAWTKAKTAALVGVGVVVAIGTAALVVKAVPHGSDLTELQGTWTGHENGVPVTVSMVLQGTNLTFHGANPNEWYKATFSLKETTNPKQFVATVTDCPAPQYVGKVSHSLYKIEGNTWTLSGNEPGNPEIPTSFEAQAGSRVFVFTKDAGK
jgi:RNA polymerase sigma factor (sigma-70 family)